MSESQLNPHAWPYLEPDEARSLLTTGDLDATRGPDGLPVYSLASLASIVGEEE